MKQEWIILIGVISFWVVVLFVLGLLAITYQKQHTPLIDQRQKYYQDWNKMKAEIEVDQIFAHPLKINFQLLDEEKVYYLDTENPVYVFSQKTKEYKMLLKFEGKTPTLAEKYFDDLDTISLRSGYKLHSKKTKTPVYLADIYLTNFRVMMNDQLTQQASQILLSKIQKACITMIWDQGTYKRGYVIQTATELYEVVSDSPSAVLVINEMIRKEKSKDERN